MRRSLELTLCMAVAAVLGACGDDERGGGETTGAGGAGAASASGGGAGGAGAASASGGGAGAGDAGSGGATPGSPAHAGGGPAAGNPDGSCAVPAEAQAADASSPTTVIGDGTPESCTSEAVVAAVAGGGVITFDCGPDPITITLEETAKIFNDTGPEIVIDGGGLVTLSGGGERRILYMNTCDEAQVWTTPSCDNQDHPRLTVQNLTFIEGDSTGDDDEGGGAIFARGGRLKVVNSRFFNNACDPTGPDLGGAGIRAFMQYEGLPLYVVNSTFGGAEGYGNACANGGGISSIGVSWTVINSLFSHNRALGNGGNPAEAGTPGGGSGGAIYNDGDTMTLALCGTRIERNEVNAHGSAIFFVSNDHTGDIVIDRSVITGNVGGSWYPTYPQISNHDDTPISVTDSTIE
ncbi:hypothetical protein [Sorangium sp. So ce1182]|uniref:hypothetical protein n=1 Tax=Sorangium sp. So ce1182 TaxID=3133334 RepID=UPI003F5E670A